MADNEPDSAIPKNHRLQESVRILLRLDKHFQTVDKWEDSSRYVVKTAGDADIMSIVTFGVVTGYGHLGYNHVRYGSLTHMRLYNRADGLALRLSAKV